MSLAFWVNKLNLKTSKTKIFIFWPKNEQIVQHLNFRISVQIINAYRIVKYLGVRLEENLHWNLQLNSLNLKLNKAIGLLCKIRYYVPKFLLKTLHYTIFHSHLTYSCQIWGQNINTLKYKHCKNKAVQIINFRANNYMEYWFLRLKVNTTASIDKIE